MARLTKLFDMERAPIELMDILRDATAPIDRGWVMYTAWMSRSEDHVKFLDVLAQYLDERGIDPRECDGVIVEHW